MIHEGTEFADNPREKMYSQGGIFSITSRILVVDLLSSMKDDSFGSTFS